MGPRSPIYLGLIWFCTIVSATPPPAPQAPPSPGRAAAWTVYPDAWSPVSPDGRTVLAFLSRDGGYGDPLHVLVDWPTRKPIGWRRLPVGGIRSWSPRGDLMLRQEGAHLDTVICRRVPDLQELWRLESVRALAWSLDGDQVIAAVGPRPLGPWDLVAVSRSGKRRVLSPSFAWWPLLVVRAGRDPALVCAAPDGEPALLSIRRVDGSLVRWLGARFAPGRFFIPRRAPLDRIAWQAQSDHRCVVGRREGGRWRYRRLRIPPAPRLADSRLVWSGTQHLMLLQDEPIYSVGVWAVSWSGRLRRLYFPPTKEPIQHLKPWVDGRHLLRGADSSLVRIDGYTGRIVDTVKITPPERRTSFRGRPLSTIAKT
jgi:hypothetical protein